MSDFNFDLVTEPAQYEEGLLRERKEIIRYWTNEGKAEFIRDIIALANTARMIGKPAYLILGVRNAATGTHDDICGISEMFERQTRIGRTKIQAKETLRQELARIIHHYITPILSPEIKFEAYSNKIVGYIVIPPITRGPFQVNREFIQGHTTYLHSGQCWLRYGESKLQIEVNELAPDDDRLGYCYAEVPHVLPSVWQTYFEKVQHDILAKWQNFPPPDEATYQELQDIESVPIQQTINGFLNQDQERLLILQGAAGSGKSLFLQRLIKGLAEEGQQDMQAVQQQEKFRPPIGYIPIQLYLRDLPRSARRDISYFTRKLCNELFPLWKTINNKRPSSPEKLFEYPDLKWLIFLDGLDEVGGDQDRQEFLHLVQEFMRTYPLVHVILTTRPVMPLEGLDNTRLVEIAPLSEKQIEAFFVAQRTDKNEEEIYTFVQRCKEFNDFWELLRLPVYLNAALPLLGVPASVSDVLEKPPEPVTLPLSSATGSSNNTLSVSLGPSVSLELNASLETEKPITDEMPQRLEEKTEDENDLTNITLPRLLDRVYEELWKREAKRQISNKIDEYRHGTYQLAAKKMRRPADRVEREQAKRILSANGLKRALELGILADNKHNHIFFFIPSAQVYSAAKRIHSDITGGSFDVIRRYTRRWCDEYRAEVTTFFEELIGYSLQSILSP